jgi:hypothetical protein
MGVGVDHLLGGHPPGLVHPHVQRRVLRVREPAVGRVELQRRDAEVEQDPVDRRVPEPGEHLGQLVVDGVLEVDPVGEPGQPDPRVGQGLGVPVQADQHRVRVRLEHRLGVPAEAERRVDVDGTAIPTQRGGQQLETPLEQHRHVRAT